jgi:general secretion pathway protein G
MRLPRARHDWRRLASRFASRLEAFKKAQSGGWTFMETLIVIGIVLVLTTMVGLMAFRFIDQAKQATAKSQIEVYGLALEAYYMDCRSYPDQSEGLIALWQKPASAPQSWNGPYLNKSVASDPWGRAYLYRVPGPNGLPFQIVSLGADGAEGGEGKNRDVKSDE